MFFFFFWSFNFNLFYCYLVCIFLKNNNCLIEIFVLQQMFFACIIFEILIFEILFFVYRSKHCTNRLSVGSEAPGGRRRRKKGESCSIEIDFYPIAFC